MLSKLTLGTAQFGMSYGINNKTGKPELDKSIEMLEFAYLNGIRSFDTAAAYGNSESVIGKWNEIYKHNDLYITSKIASITNKGLEKKSIDAYLEEQVYSSLEKLRVDKLDNIMLHDFSDIINYGDLVFESLTKLKDKNYVKNIGCSLYDLESIDSFLKYKFDTIQFPGSIFNQSIIESKKMDVLKENNVKTFVRSAFVQGLIFMNPQKLPSELLEIKKYLIELDCISREFNQNTSEIAINYLLNNENVDNIVFGVDSLTQLKQICEINGKNKIDNEIIINKFSEIPIELIDPRKWR